MVPEGTWCSNVTEGTTDTQLDTPHYPQDPLERDHMMPDSLTLTTWIAQHPTGPKRFPTEASR
jgi:hypothetical protein